MIRLQIWLTIKKLNPAVTELFIGARKLNRFIVSFTQSCYKVPKEVRLNTMHFFIMKTPNKRQLHQIAIYHSSDIDFEDFIKIYKKYTAKRYSFLVNDTNLPSDNLLGFRKNLLEWIYWWHLMIRLKMKIYYINREAVKISGLSSGKLDKYKYLKDEEILPSNKKN